MQWRSIVPFSRRKSLSRHWKFCYTRWVHTTIIFCSHDHGMCLFDELLRVCKWHPIIIQPTIVRQNNDHRLCGITPYLADLSFNILNPYLTQFWPKLTTILLIFGTQDFPMIKISSKILILCISRSKLRICFTLTIGWYEYWEHRGYCFEPQVICLLVDFGIN